MQWQGEQTHIGPEGDTELVVTHRNLIKSFILSLNVQLFRVGCPSFSDEPRPEQKDLQENTQVPVQFGN